MAKGKLAVWRRHEYAGHDEAGAENAGRNMLKAQEEIAQMETIGTAGGGM